VNPLDPGRSQTQTSWQGKLLVSAIVLPRNAMTALTERASRFAFPAVLILAATLRAIFLRSVPPPLADEVLAAVDFHSTLFQGRHFTGAVPGLLAHLTPILDGRWLATALLGRSVTDLRVVSVLFGVGSVALAAKLGDELGDRRLGLLTAFFLAVMPWHIYFSRIYLPASETLFLTLAALVLGLIGLRARSVLYCMGAIAAAAWSIYLYPVAILLTPLLLVTVIVFRWEDVRAFGWRRSVTVAIFGLLILIPYVVGRFTGADAAVTVINEVIVSRMIWTHGLSSTDVFLRVLGNWSSYVTPRFLFLSGDPNVRQSIQSLGEVGWAVGVLGVVGIVSAVLRRSRADLLAVSWLLLFPLASALTFYDASANSVRAVVGCVVWALLAAMGLRTLLGVPSETLRSILAACAGLAIAAQLVVFSAAYFGSYSRERSAAFETGYDRIYDVLEERGVQDVPITLHAGYQRDAMLQYFSDYRLIATQSLLACYELPSDVVRFTVLPRVFIVREDPDFWREPDCTHRDLIRRDIRALRRAGDVVEVLATYPNAPGSRFGTAILFVTEVQTRG
jgi:4-amino-4-deoxy-L-arabinose transferase-like glycosyltransferase